MSYVINPGATTPNSWTKTQQPIAAYNCSSEDAPPFACMQLKKPAGFRRGQNGTTRHAVNEAADTSYAQELIGNQLVWLVSKPDTAGTDRQDPAQFVFAGPRGMLAHSFGQVYQNYPARTLWDSTEDTLEIWGSCGPVANEWFVTSEGSAFTCMGLDASALGGSGVLTIWVERGVPPAPGGVLFRNSSGQTITPYAPMYNSGAGIVVTGGTAYVVCSKPSTIFDGHWLINGGESVANNATGEGSWRAETSGPVAVDPNIGTVQVGQELGVVPSSFYIGAGRSGFIALGPKRTQDGVLVVDCRQRYVDRVLVRAAADGTQTSDGVVTVSCEILYRPTGAKLQGAGWDEIDVYLTFQNSGDTVAADTIGYASRGPDGLTTSWEGDFNCDASDTLQSGS